jgi:tetratricopeptide (TPR) repeat protein
MTIQEKLLHMLKSESFDELEEFAKPTSLKKMSDDERDLLALLFIKQAEHQIKNGDNGVFESCEMATKVGHDKSHMFFRKGMVFSYQRENMRCLLAAAEAFQQSANLTPEAADAWIAWGNVLYDIGTLSEDITCYQQANEKYELAAQLLGQTKDPVAGQLYWRWGLCQYTVGTSAGEPRDLLSAVEKYNNAEALGIDDGNFYNDFGDLYATLGQLLPSSEFPEKAIDRYRQATLAAPKLFEAWLSLGCALTLYYQTSGDEGDFLDAHQAFEKCVELESSEAMVWVRWGHLLACAGRITSDIDKIYASFEKFEAASLLEADMPRLLLHWGEALLFAGVHEERLDFLRESEAKINRAVRSLSTAEEAWAIYGRCLNELGNYFNDAKYYQQAIDKYQYALQLFPSSHALAMGLAHAYIALGDQNTSIDAFHSAISTFEKASAQTKSFYPVDYNEWGVAWMKLAEITQKMEHAAAAVEKFEQAITLGLQSMTFNELDTCLLYNYGAAIDFLGDFHNDVSYYEKAVQALAHVVAVDEAHPYARYNLALALFHRAELSHDFDSFHKAIDIIHDLSAADPEDDILWNQYGTMLLTLADLSHESEASPDLVNNLFSEAEQRLQRAVACGSIVAHYNLACLYALTGNKQNAMRHLENADRQGALPGVDELLDEEWLESLHDLPEFRALVGRQYLDEEGDKVF